MRRPFVFFVVVAAFLMLFTVTRAAGPDLTEWFMHATAYNTAKTLTPMAKPDFIGGKTLDTMVCGGWNGPGPAPAMFNGVWQLMKYDRKHTIALAEGSADQCSAALFVASRPPVAVPDADFSRFGTGRGLRIGSTYADVLATYGGKPVQHARHFVLAYGATAYGHAVTTGHPLVKLPEEVTIVIDDGRVSSISIYISESELF